MKCLQVIFTGGSYAQQAPVMAAPQGNTSGGSKLPSEVVAAANVFDINPCYYGYSACSCNPG